MKTTQTVVTRFAPSPTGHMHVGSYRTAFFAYLFAKKHGGKFILRIEDTDKERSREEYTEEIFTVFKKIGITYDESYVQSQHVERHKELLLKLIEEDKAYISKEEAKDGSGVIKDIIRFRNPNKVVTFTDLIRGEISVDTTDLGDFVIAKNINEPLFHLAVVVDDHDEGVTHVIRAEEHIANTPRQILIHEALGFTIPNYAHLPIVLGPDKSKLSKRKGAVPVVEYLERGYLPAALLNAICLCGWNPGTEQELFSREELEQVFDLDKVQKAGAVFNEDKLNWFNREYIKQMSSEAFWIEATPWVTLFVEAGTPILARIEQLIRDRINSFSEIKTLFEAGEFAYFFERPEVSPEMLVWKNDTLENAKKHITQVITIVSAISEEKWEYDFLKESIMKYANEAGRGNVLWPTRVALSGKEKSPDPFELASILGKEETLARLSAI